MASIPEDVSRRYANETDRLLNEANTRSITIRLLGAQAIRERCPQFGHLLDEIGRSYVDIDFVGLSEQRKELRKFFAENEYEVDRQVLIAAEGSRYIFQSPGEIVVDLFIDRLDFCHRIDLRNRLQLDSPTIPLADLLLSKLQIVEIAEKDLQDVAVLMLEHEVGEGNRADVVDSRYISGLLATDWGFYFTVNRNLDRLRTFLPACTWLEAMNKKVLVKRIDQIKKEIEGRSKTLRWRVRSKFGTSIRWYKEVSERGRVF